MNDDPPAEPSGALFDFELPRSPYPGLRHFNASEWPLFFGRERVAEHIIDRLVRNQLVVVHGDSGCGKSSTVRAGVLARLDQEHARSGTSWRMAAMLPREAPMLRLAKAFASLDGGEEDASRIHEILRLLNRGADAPAAIAELLLRGEDDHICILIDQFEELFAFAAKRGNKEEAQLFVNILKSLQRNSPPRLYIALTMRSEFLGACARFEGFAETVNATQYLLPHMERRALTRAIREPATLYGGEISLNLAERLIADAGSGQDRLPLIQHALNLMWENRGGSPRVTLDHYDNAVAKAKEISGHQRGTAALLSAHADEVMTAAAPEPDRAKTIAHIFRALTEINADGHAVRRPQTLGELAAVTGSNLQSLKDLLSYFRADGASFVTPFGGDDIEPETLIDISHEALIRCWQPLSDSKNGWLQNEFKDGLTWRSLLIQAESFQNDPKSVLSAARTEELGQWLEKIPSAEWSRRYEGGWEDVQQLMDASRRAQEEEVLRVEELNRARAHNARRRRWLIGVVGFSALVLVAAWFANDARLDAIELRDEAQTQRQDAIAARREADEARQLAEDARQRAIAEREEAIASRDFLQEQTATLEQALIQARGANSENTSTIYVGSDIDVALVVAQRPAAQGVVSQDGTLTEFEFSDRLVASVKLRLDERNVNSVIVYRDNNPRGLSKLPAKINAYRPKMAVSFHANGFNGTASGTTTLYFAASDRSKRIAAILQGSVLKALELKNRQIRGINTNDRGSSVLARVAAPMVQLEPFFLDNDADLQVALRRENVLAARLASGIIQALTDVIGVELPSGESASTQ